ncbi:Flp pilus assembly complex ATPase component TadA [Candidatus Woesearchaeota archaeon]|nr:Flp pilus assembly complex ATPase component TadA [Candidatus Woesearchaeota archaeon]
MAKKGVKKREKARSSSPRRKDSARATSSARRKAAGRKGGGRAAKESEKRVRNRPLIGPETRVRTLDKYAFDSSGMPISIAIYATQGEFVPIYEVTIASISKTTEIILEKIRRQLIKQVNLGMVDIVDIKETNVVEDRFKETIRDLIEKYFPDINEKNEEFLTTYLIQKSLGLGNIEILMADKQLEEIVVNSADEPVWVYHKKHGWLKTNFTLRDEDQTKHYATMIGRKVGRQITVLEPLLDAHLSEGDRVNATLMPISTMGNTITIRKFSRDPLTITHFIKYKTLSAEAAALIWHCMQYELSAIISGGTASGKTSMLNVLANFFPPNQRIISIEDTRELRLPKYLHWVPMSTRLPNAEGRGEITMEHLLVNALRQRPDRILVGEVRRKREAETLFEAIHTGHSCYATFHANTAAETLNRLTNPPIDVPKTMMPAISMIIQQFRNRRTGLRRTFQIAEITEAGEANTILQYEPKRDILVERHKSQQLMDTLELYTGSTPREINYALKEKVSILKYLVKQQVEDIDSVGRVMAEFYVNRLNLMRFVRSGASFLKHVRDMTPALAQAPSAKTIPSEEGERGKGSAATAPAKGTRQEGLTLAEKFAARKAEKEKAHAGAEERHGDRKRGGIAKLFSHKGKRDNE